jgi:hypothetical protein
VWEAALLRQNNIIKIKRVHRLINIKMCKAFQTLSYEASCIVAGTIPLQKTIQETINIYKTTHNSQDYDKPVEVAC